jgi:DNA invertase Pin-like site-specific DNA recombinase
VLALEASRLARNNRDWHHLIDLCAMTATLVIDHDGVYDPCVLNDRLLLGLKRHDSQSTSCSTFWRSQQI